METLTKGYDESTEIRESYEILPLQGVWTWLTGKEILNRDQLWRSSSAEMVAWSLVWVAVGVLLTVLAVYYSENIVVSVTAYVIGVIFSASGARYVVATIIHHGVHGHLFRNKLVNKVLCEILSTVFIVQPYEPYRRFHVYEHHGKDFSTFQDKDLAAIYKLGFTPGKSKKALYRNLLLTLINPSFHLSYLWGRLRSNYVGVALYRRIMSLVWMGFLVGVGMKYGALFFSLIIAVPFVIVYQMASLLHLLTEHVWLLRRSGETVRDSHVKNCLARFCGSRCPADFSLRNSGRWLKWGIAHLFFHLPCRMLVVQGSLVCHDWHHRFGSAREWYAYAQLREKDARKMALRGTYDYVDIWGLHNCLDYVFTMISNADPVDIHNLEYRLN
ncbi:hypothetical protein [Erwinia sp. S43]|uniref:hypothetical protein n=1 Tax=Erwinia sp. S43 TaxID=2769339 RepID=UPI00190BD54D|nr:hypothetical protein [Erwinia sp. S43]